MVIRPPWLIVAALAAISCSDEGTNHDLISLTGVTPKSVESGDTVQITGSGFAEGSPARVAFRGDIFRAGQTPQRNVEIVVRTRDTAKNTISFVVNDELERAFSGTAGSESHAAFRGTVTLAFAASPGSLAPVTGTLRDVTLEFVPKVPSAEVARERQQLARDALNFLGLGLADDGTADCCVVATSEGRALMGGVKPGDRIVEFDGIPVRSTSDLIPAGRNRTAALSIRRDSSTRLVTRSVDVQGFRWSVPSELAPAGGALVFVLGVLLFLLSPLRRALSIVARVGKAIATRNDARPLRSVCNQGMNVLRRQLSDLPLPDFAAVRIVQVLSVIALGGLCAIMTTRDELISGELDLFLWWLLVALAVCVATFVNSVSCLKNRFVIGLRHSAQVLLHQLPVLVLIIVSAALNGSSRTTDIVRMQGAWPNSWLLFHDPAFTALSLAAMGSLVPLSDGVATFTKTREQERASGGGAAAALLAFITGRIHLWAQSILLAVLVFGGWAVDSEPLSLPQRHGIGIVVPTLLLLAKSWAITVLLSGARVLFRNVKFSHTTPWAFKFGVPTTLLLGALSISWVWGLRRWSVSWADGAMHWTMLSISVALLVIFALRARSRIRSGQRPALENHWM